MADNRANDKNALLGDGVGTTFTSATKAEDGGNDKATGEELSKQGKAPLSASTKEYLDRYFGV